MRGIIRNASRRLMLGDSNSRCGGIADDRQLQGSKCFNNGNISPVSIIVISISVIYFMLILLLVFICCWLERRREKQLVPMPKDTFLNVSYERLFKATGKFSSSQLIGVGSFGFLYKGTLDPYGNVAVKVFNLQRKGASNSFTAECKALRNIRHRNIIKVITVCSSVNFQGEDFKAIVYKFMPNGSLDKWLHPAPEIKEKPFKTQSLTLLQRINIAIDVASALHYLHHQCQEPIIHCDLKPSNILLDKNMTAHIGDFGQARFLSEISTSYQNNFVGVTGTIGYVPPEYGLGNKVSTNGDVYSYGILLLEIMTRKKQTDFIFEGDLNLNIYARMALPDRVIEIVDPVLMKEEMAANNHKLSQARTINIKDCLISLVRIGVACSMESPQDRMNINLVIQELQQVRNVLLQSKTGFDRQGGRVQNIHCTA